jgi:hypothetical protein
MKNLIKNRFWLKPIIINKLLFLWLKPEAIKNTRIKKALKYKIIGFYQLPLILSSIATGFIINCHRF